MNKAKTATATSKTVKRKSKSLKVRTNVKAGGIRMQNRCETLQHPV